MRVELHPDADAEFARQVDYYEEREPGLGLRFYREIINRLNWISSNATLPSCARNYRRVNLQVSPFYIAHVEREDLVWVLAVAHGRRQPGYWKRRME